MTFCSASKTEAQSADRHHWGVGAYGGGVFPLNDLRDSAKLGYHIGGMVDRRVSTSLAIRFDVAFNKFSDRTLTEAPTFREVGTNLLFGAVSAEVFSGRSAEPTNLRKARPYLLAGVGAYKFRFDHVCRGSPCAGRERVGTSRTRLGFHVGAGSTLLVSRWMTFLQLGYHITRPNSGEDGNRSILLASFGLRLR